MSDTAHRALTAYAEAYASPSRSVWPGCGDGRCRPCGRLHDFGYSDSLGRWVHRFACAYNYQRGCPRPIPKPTHTWQGGRCARCGAPEPWLAPDGRAYRTIRLAAQAGWKRGQLKRASEVTTA